VGHAGVLDTVGGTGVRGKVRTTTVAQFARRAKMLGVVLVVVQCSALQDVSVGCSVEAMFCFWSWCSAQGICVAVCGLTNLGLCALGLRDVAHLFKRGSKQPL